MHELHWVVSCTRGGAEGAWKMSVSQLRKHIFNPCPLLLTHHGSHRGLSGQSLSPTSLPLLTALRNSSCPCLSALRFFLLRNCMKAQVSVCSKLHSSGTSPVKSWCCTKVEASRLVFVDICSTCSGFRTYPLQCNQPKHSMWHVLSTRQGR